MKLNSIVCSIALFLSIAMFTTPSYASELPIHPSEILSHAPGLNPVALHYAIRGYEWAFTRDKVSNPNVLTIIDFSLPSYEKRVWVIDLRTSRLLMQTYTTQGKGSGEGLARHFTNSPRSEATSLGVYKTLYSYYGKHGFSMRLQGLEPGINSSAFSRAVVVHPAWYSSPEFVRIYHRTGASWGCFGLSPNISKKFISITKNGSIIFAYATPEKHDSNLS